ncbi:MAG: hypothetical protein IJT04_06135 [Bacteroidales bacterium]|nr:hypothetical protein [Bacteroidales bacterium]
MKTTRITLLVLAFFAVQQIGEAQTLITSTTATTTVVHSKSGREKGFVFRPEIGLGINNFYNFKRPFVYNLNGTIAYQYNPFFAFGGGVGGDYYPSLILSETNYYELFDEYEFKIAVIPIFANMRAYFCDREWSPFFDVKIGYALPLAAHQVWNSYGYSASDELKYLFSGLKLNCGLGLQYKGIDIVFALGKFDAHLKTKPVVFSNDHFGWVSSYTISIAYNVQLKNRGK